MMDSQTLVRSQFEWKKIKIQALWGVSIVPEWMSGLSCRNPSVRGVGDRSQTDSWSAAADPAGSWKLPWHCKPWFSVRTAASSPGFPLATLGNGPHNSPVQHEQCDQGWKIV